MQFPLKAEIEAEEYSRQRDLRLQQREQEWDLRRQQQQQQEIESLKEVYTQKRLSPRQINILIYNSRKRSLFNKTIQHCKPEAARLLARWLLEELDTQRDIYKKNNPAAELPPILVPDVVKIVNAIHDGKINIRFAQELTLKLYQKSEHDLDIEKECADLDQEIEATIRCCCDNKHNKQMELELQEDCIRDLAHNIGGAYFAKDLAKRRKLEPEKDIDSILDDMKIDTRYSQNYCPKLKDYVKKQEKLQEKNFSQAMNKLYRSHWVEGKSEKQVNKEYRVKGIDEREFKEIMRRLMVWTPVHVATLHPKVDIEILQKWQEKAFKIRDGFVIDFEKQMRTFKNFELEVVLPTYLRRAPTILSISVSLRKSSISLSRLIN